MNKVSHCENILTISGANISKCMSCGRCSASCPVGEEMDIRPHQFVSRLREKNVENLLKSEAIWQCLSCFACIERCPRDVKPARVIEATRLVVLRQKEQEKISPDEIPELVDENMPQQLLVSTFRKYRK